MITAKEIIDEIDKALKQFGEYSYLDKGAEEVMSVGKISTRLKDMSAIEIVTVLEEVEKEHRLPEPFLSAVIMSLQDWQDPKADELFKSELFNRYY